MEVPGISKKKIPEVYTEPWKWSLPKLSVSVPSFNPKRVLVWLFRDKARVIRRLLFIPIFLLYFPAMEWLHLGPDALKVVPDVLSTVNEPQKIVGEDGQFLIFHIASNVWFRVIGADQYWRIFHECQNHIVSDPSGKVLRSECEHSDNFVKTNSNEWHRYTVRYDEEVRVTYKPGVTVELRVITEPSGHSGLSVSVYRFLYAFMFVIVYILCNGDILDTLPRRFRAG